MMLGPKPGVPISDLCDEMAILVQFQSPSITIERDSFCAGRDYQFSFDFLRQPLRWRHCRIAWILLAVESKSRLIACSNASSRYPDPEIVPTVCFLRQNTNWQLGDRRSRDDFERWAIRRQNQRRAPAATAPTRTDEVHNRLLCSVTLEIDEGSCISCGSLVRRSRIALVTLKEFLEALLLRGSALGACMSQTARNEQYTKRENRDCCGMKWHKSLRPYAHLAAARNNLR
jgi:hypothetical protein